MMIKNFLRVLFTPSTWIRNHPTDEGVDAFFLRSNSSRALTIGFGSSFAGLSMNFG